MRPLRLIAPALVLATLVPAPTSAGSSEIVFTKLLDSDDLIPGGQHPFGSFDIGENGSYPGRRRVFGESHLAMDDDGNLAFFASDRVFAIIDGEIHLVSEPRGEAAHIEIEGARVTFAQYGGGSFDGGIFRWQPDTEPIEIAGQHTFVPDGGDCVFYTKEDQGVAGHPFQVDGDTILFRGATGACENGDLGGTFLWREGSLDRVESAASIGDGLLAFFGQDRALYAGREGEAPERIVGLGDPIPGSSAPFYRIWPIEVAAGRVAFPGDDVTLSHSSVFAWESGVLSLVAETGMELPGGRKLGRIAYHDPLRLGDDRIAIFGSDDQGQLIFLLSLERGWERVVDLSGPDRHYQDEGMDEFDGSQLVIEGLRGIVHAVREDGTPVFAWQRTVSVIRPDGSLLHVLGEGDLLEGRHVESVFSGDLRGNKLALGVSDASGQHLYVAELPPIGVDIDIKPRRARNKVRASAHQPMLVAILGSETFYVEDVNVATLGLGPGAARPVGKARLRDVNGDAWDDLVLRFRPRESGIVRGETEVCLTGETFDGLEFEGCDSVRTGRAPGVTR